MVESSDPLPTLYTASAVQETIVRLLGDLHSGRIRPNVAAAMTPLLNLQLRAIQATEHESKIAELQRQLAETQENTEFKTMGQAKTVQTNQYINENTPFNA